MSRATPIAISCALIGVGLCAWAWTAQPLMDIKDLNPPTNPLGINGSPYGEVLAMAMQGPIDTVFHHTENDHHHQPGESCDDCEDHDDDHDAPPLQPSPTNQPSSLKNQFLQTLVSMDQALETRNNPKSATQAHKLYLRRKIEDKLRFAYQLDPSHYANYNSLHLFLTEPQLGTRPQLTTSAAQLAEQTISYCLERNDDPRRALTAAAATSNLLELMLNDRSNPNTRFTTTQMRQYLNLLDYCLNRYHSLAQQWQTSGTWNNLSPMRIKECADRLRFITVFRDYSQKTIEQIESNTKPQPANSNN